MRSNVLASRPAIIPDMPIVGSDGALLGKVDRVVGARIRLQRIGVSEADQFFIPMSWVASVTDRVTLDRPADRARGPARDSEERSMLYTATVWGTVAFIGVVFMYALGSFVGRTASPAPVAVASTGAGGSDEVAPISAPKGIVIPNSTRPTGPVAAAPNSIAEFLNSNDPTPRVFSLESIGFAPGSAALAGDAAKAVTGIAEVMTAHLNTQIKLAAAQDAGALPIRRATAIKAALVGEGVADYRITTGVVRRRSREAPDLEMIVLAK